MSIVKTFQVLARLTVGVTFLYAAGTKAFHGNLAREQTTVFAEWSHSPGARFGLIAAEMILATWLFSGIKPNVAGIVTLLLISAFTGLLILELKKGHPRPCGCTGTRLVSTDPQQIRASLRTALGRNAILMVCAGLLFLSVRRQESDTNVHARERFASSGAG
jgi:hypothetical protein